MSPFKNGRLYWASIRGKKIALKTADIREARMLEARLRSADHERRLGLEPIEKNPYALTLARACRRVLGRRPKGDRLAYAVAKHIERDPIGRLQLEQVTRGVVRDWMQRRIAQGASVALARKLRAYLSSIFRELIERELYMGDNPARGLRVGRVEEPEHYTMPWHWVPLIIEQMPSTEWQARAILAAYTGMRAGELRALRWEQVDLRGRFLQIERSKTGARRAVPLHVVVVDTLRALKGKRTSGPVFTSSGWQKASERVTRALERAGLEPADAARATWHGLRGAWASRMLDCGADPYSVRLIGGWTAGDVMARHYARPAAALLEAVDRLHYDGAQVRQMTTTKARNA